MRSVCAAIVTLSFREACALVLGDPPNLDKGLATELAKHNMSMDMWAANDEEEKKKKQEHIIGECTDRFEHAEFRNGVNKVEMYRFIKEGGHLMRAPFQPLPSGSVFVTLSGFEGDIIQVVKNNAADVKVHAYEAMPSKYNKIAEDAKKYPNLHLENIGLSSRAGSVCFEKVHDEGWSPIDVVAKDEDTCGPRASEEGKVKKVVDELAKIGTVDMLQVNCEGCEYEILPLLLKAENIKAIEVRWSHGPKTKKEYCELRDAMKKQFDVSFDYDYYLTHFIRKAAAM